MKLISLLTDFTQQDGYVGVMKGVILSIAPDAPIIDLSHQIPPQDVQQAARMLGRSAPYFPAGTIFVCVVDPGVGTRRRGIIARLGTQSYIGPDNGLVTLLYQSAERSKDQIAIFTLENPGYQVSPVSRTFHGRDIFAPAAAHYFNGAPIESFGQPVSDPVLVEFPEPRRTRNGWQGEVISIDSFGNLACNLTRAHIDKPESTRIHIKHRMIHGLKSTFGQNQPGELTAMLDSFGYLSISVVNGSARDELDAEVGNMVKIFTDGD